MHFGVSAQFAPSLLLQSRCLTRLFKAALVLSRYVDNYDFSSNARQGCFHCLVDCDCFLDIVALHQGGLGSIWHHFRHPRYFC